MTPTCEYCGAELVQQHLRPHVWHCPTGCVIAVAARPTVEPEEDRHGE